MWLNGVCPGGCADSAGLHLKATSSQFTGRALRISNFYQNIKGDRTADTEVSDSSILDSELFNDDPALTGGGTAIDLVGGKRWRIAGNYVHDWARGDLHYGIFIKGGSSDSIIERNLVIGSKLLPHGGGAEVGISFGGGGTGPQFCAPGNMGSSSCTCEDFNSVARNNIVINVSDAAFHSKWACGSQFLNNTVIDADPGLQVQIVGGGAPVQVHNNAFGGRISGTAMASDNALDLSTSDFSKVYNDPSALDFSEGPDPSAVKNKGPTLGLVSDDYFGAARTGPNDWGAIELPAAGRVWPWGNVVTGPSDAGVSGVDAGIESAGDAGTAFGGDGGTDPSVGSGADGGQNEGVIGGCGCSAGSGPLLGLALAAFAGVGVRKKVAKSAT